MEPPPLAVIAARPLEDMYPLLDQKEFLKKDVPDATNVLQDLKQNTDEIENRLKKNISTNTKM